MKTAELTGRALNWAVSNCEGLDYWYPELGQSEPDYSTNWAQGGLIIERERISIFDAGNCWGARPLQDGHTPVKERFGSTPLIAAMRCYVASKLGNEVEIPEELVGGC